MWKILWIEVWAFKFSLFISGTNLMERTRSPPAGSHRMRFAPTLYAPFARWLCTVIDDISTAAAAESNEGEKEEAVTFGPLRWNWYRHSTDITSGATRNDTGGWSVKDAFTCISDDDLLVPHQVLRLRCQRGPLARVFSNGSWNSHFVSPVDSERTFNTESRFLFGE